MTLFIELDGMRHDHSVVYDAHRADYCRARGFTTLRISNRDVMENLEGAVSHIKSTLAQARPRPLPQAGGEKAG
ncbi:DUF559 domain-containing protein [Sphingobium mellinum]|uniref:DUF559 domain-containing protein n=1 Tax=Sphingobium mellinum TaxID=1387166 RepID=UPI003BF484ED